LVSERVLSYSSINLYHDCPFKWKLKYIDKIPERSRHYFSFGKTMHSVVEAFHVADHDMSVKDMMLVYRDSWLSEGYSDIDHEKELWDEGRRIVESYHAKHSVNRVRPLAVEYEFRVKIAGVPVRGFIDRVDQHEGGISILDYKTGRPFVANRIDDDKQLAMYQVAMDLCEGFPGVSRVGLYHLPSTTEFWGGRRLAFEVAFLEKWVVDAAKGIGNEEFKPRPESKWCGWCDFKSHCPVFGRNLL